MIALPAGLALANDLFAAGPYPFRIRTITAGVSLTLDSWQRQMREASDFLHDARADFQEQGYEVQTLRIATQPLPEYLSEWRSKKGLQTLSELDDFCEEQNFVFSVGPIINSDEYEPELGDWAAEVIRATSRLSFSIGEIGRAHV